MRIVIVGCGNMGSALARRLAPTQQLFFYDHNAHKSEKLAAYGTPCPEIPEADLTILAIKPQSLPIVIPNNMIVSLLAGTSIATLRRHFPHASSLVRMMPNLALTEGQGVIGLASEGPPLDYLAALFAPLGKIYWLPEEKMDALTALTSSGPAFFFAIVEAMIDAGIAMGFSSHESKDLIYNMLQGSLSLLSKKEPADLIKQITSPQGTTLAGLKKFEELGIKEGLMNTFLAAYERAKELGRNSLF